jgi:hypothetical protein
MTTNEREIFDRAADALHDVVYSIKIDKVNFDELENRVRTYDVGKADNIKLYLNDIRNTFSTLTQSDVGLQEIINVVNNVVTATTNGTSSVENIEDLKAFLNQALPAWQNAMMNQTVFQQQFHQVPPRI